MCDLAQCLVNEQNRAFLSKDQEFLPHLFPQGWIRTKGKNENVSFQWEWNTLRFWTDSEGGTQALELWARLLVMCTDLHDLHDI